MTYMERDFRRVNLILGVVIAVVLVVFTAATLLDLDIVYNLASPVITGLSVFLMYRCQESMGKYWAVARWVLIGILIWFFSDIFWILYKYALPGNRYLELITDNLYLFPDYFYVAGVIQYVKIRVGKNDFTLTLVDTFALSTVGFVIAQQWLERNNPEYAVNVEILNMLLYFFAAIFTMILILIIFFKTGVRRHAVPFYILVGTLFLHSVLEMRYTAMLFLGKESESTILDILYLLVMVIFTFSFSFGKLKEVNIEKDFQVDNRENRVNRNFKKIYWANTVIFFALGSVLYAVDFLDERDLFIIIGLAMIYVIMCKTIQANILSEELITQQKNENARLEEMVKEKTRELREMNAYLEKISNTDALTGLYNRRYGIEFLSGLINEAENYPIALYSIDLNYFKPINDNYGHDMGDVVLKEVGHRLAGIGDRRCTAIRIGGDEFLVIFRNASSLTAIEDLGRNICEKMDLPIEAHVVSEEKGELHHTFQISASIGVARFPADTADMDTLFKMADEALYAIKHTHEKSAMLLYSRMQDKKD